MRALFAALPDLIDQHGATSQTVLTARADLAVACAQAGEFESALYQVDELVNDALREHGPDSEIAATTRRARSHVEQIVAQTVAAGSGSVSSGEEFAQGEL